jgi:hypothetical protein
MIERERVTDEVSGRKILVAVNKTVVNNLVRVGAFDAFDARSHLLEALAEYFETTSVRKRAAVSWEPQHGYAPSDSKPQDYLDWERELVGVYTSGHPAEGIAAADIDIYEAEALAHEARSAYERGKSARILTAHAANEILDFEGLRDEGLRLVAGVLNDVSWRPNRSGVGGRYSGKIEDSTGSARFTYWRPRDTEISVMHEAFRAFEAAIREEQINGAGAALVGAFTFNPKYQKEPELSVYEWKPMALPRLAVAPRLAPTRSTSETERLAREAELFGPDPVVAPVPAGAAPVASLVSASAPEAAAPLVPRAPLATPEAGSDFFDL